MKFIDKIILAVSPSSLITDPGWQLQWHEEENKRFMQNSKFFSAVFVVIAIVHIFIVDIPQNLTPMNFWIFFRLSVALVFLITFLSTFNDAFTKSKYSKIPFLISIIYLVYMQGQTFKWYDKASFFYVPLLAVFGVIALRLSLVLSLITYIVILSIAHESFVLKPSVTGHMLSAALVGVVVIIVWRSRLKLDLENFILTQQHIIDEKRIIQGQIALNDQLRAFLAREHVKRMEFLINTKNLTPLQAMDEVLRPRKCLAAILYSDIRGFTGMTKLGEGALIEAVTPAQKACIDAIENYQGVPRVVGDLVFTYFDHSNPIKNLINSLSAAFSLYEVTKELNDHNELPEYFIRRYVIISFGVVITGNIGGTEGARDITVLGNAANLPSRLDTLTKEVELKNYLIKNPIILSSEAVDLLKVILPEIEIDYCVLDDLGITIRDFSEEKKIFFLYSTDENFKKIKGRINESAGINYIKAKYRGLFYTETT